MSTKRKFPFLMGCDPEFLLINAGKPVSAYAAGKITKDGSYHGTTDKIAGSIGQDGSMCEIRPSPSKDITEIAKNIKTLLKNFANSPLSAFEFSPLSHENGHACGGHIHIGVPDDLVQDKYSYGDARISQKGHRIARQLFSFYLPLWLADTQSNTAMRCKTSYGKYGDYRLDPHAYTDKNGVRHESYTLELRTPTAEWLTCPKTMLATFAYVGVVMNELLNHPEKMNEYEDFIFKNKDEFAVVERTAQNRNNIFLKPLLAKIKRAVKKFELYEDYKREINWLFDQDKVQAEKQKYGYEILKGWGLRSKEPTIKDLTNDKTISKKLKEIREEGYDQNPSEFNPHYLNGEKGVAELVHGLNKTALAYKWNMKHRYIFFGLSKKTSEGTIVGDMNYNLLYGAEFVTDEERRKRLKRAFKKMYDRYVGTKTNGKNTYIIGLPKVIRKENNIQQLIEFIHNLENKLPASGETVTEKDIQLSIKSTAIAEKTPEEIAESRTNPLLHHTFSNSY